MRTYGKEPYTVVLVHGGPGAYGEMRPLGEELGKNFGVLEPKQTKRSISELVLEMKHILDEKCKTPVILVGWSWGAWLSFIFAAKHPTFVKKLVLISSGPLESQYAKTIFPTRLKRLSESDQELLKGFCESKSTLKTLETVNALFKKCDQYDPIEVETEGEFDFSQHQAIMKEANEIRESKKLLNYGEKIKCPLTVIHGDYDPHPYEGVKLPLEKKVKNIQFFLLKCCGHKPWEEKQARDSFYSLLKDVLKEEK